MRRRTAPIVTRAARPAFRSGRLPGFRVNLPAVFFTGCYVRLLELGQRLVIAHRGASGERPENTLSAFSRAVELGADAIELDVRLARDGTAMVIHDATLDRTTDERGPVRARDASELARLGLPTLAEVIEGFPATELLIELKEAAAQPEVARVIAEAGAEQRCVVAAAEAAPLVGFTGGTVAVCGARPDIATLRWRSALGLGMPRPGYRALSVPHRYRGIPVATRRFFRAAAAIGVPVHVWTVDDPSAARRLWAAGAAGIVTNDVAAMVAARAAVGRRS